LKCIKCGKKAEFHLPDDEDTVLCEDHAIEYLKKSRESFLPRIHVSE
jgi:hypothetical protein